MDTEKNIFLQKFVCLFSKDQKCEISHQIS